MSGTICTDENTPFDCLGDQVYSINLLILRSNFRMKKRHTFRLPEVYILCDCRAVRTRICFQVVNIDGCGFCVCVWMCVCVGGWVLLDVMIFTEKEEVGRLCRAEQSRNEVKAIPIGFSCYYT